MTEHGLGGSVDELVTLIVRRLKDLVDELGGSVNELVTMIMRRLKDLVDELAD